MDSCDKKEAAKEELNRQFDEFLLSGELNPPESLTRRIFAHVRRNLNPSPWMIFSKLSVLHLMSSLVNLSICPQFGIRLLGDGMGLMHYFMSLGLYGCMLACGAFFMGTSALVAGIFLKREELRTLRKHQVLQVSALILLSMSGFVVADAEILWGFGFAWLTGCLGAGIAILEVSWHFRRSVYA